MWSITRKSLRWVQRIGLSSSCVAHKVDRDGAPESSVVVLRVALARRSCHVPFLEAASTVAVSASDAA